jgi:drug/metabolite transporter (DMT)-like permease
VLPALLVVISFVLGLEKDRPRALLLSAAAAVSGMALVVVMSVVEETDFLDGASGYVQLAAGFVACLVAALAGGAVRDRRARTAAP